MAIKASAWVSCPGGVHGRLLPDADFSWVSFLESSRGCIKQVKSQHVEHMSLGWLAGHTLPVWGQVEVILRWLSCCLCSCLEGSVSSVQISFAFLSCLNCFPAPSCCQLCHTLVGHRILSAKGLLVFV